MHEENSTTNGRTPKQIEASRRNGKKAKGPRTPEGKDASSANALVHGLLSRNLLSFGEDPEECAELGAELHCSLKPVGSLEECLVERIANLLWRLRRAARMETGMLEAEHVKVTLDHIGANKTHVWDMSHRTEEELDKVDEHLDAAREIAGVQQTFVDPLAPQQPLFRGKVRNHTEGWSKLQLKLNPPREASLPTEDLDDLSQKVPPASDKAYRMLLAKAFEGIGESLFHLNRYEISLERSLQRTIAQFLSLQRHRLSNLQPVDVDFSTDRAA